MKMVFTAPSVVPCDFLKSLLKAEGIESMLKNQGGSSILGRGLPVPGGPELAFAWPEVWVNDGDYEIASGIAAEFQQIHYGDHTMTEDADRENASDDPSKDLS